MRFIHPQEIQGLSHLVQEIGFAEFFRIVAKIYEAMPANEQGKHYIVSKLSTFARMIEDDFSELKPTDCPIAAIEEQKD